MRSNEVTTAMQPPRTSPLLSFRRAEWLLPVAILFLITIGAFAFQLRRRSEMFSQDVSAGRDVVEHVTSLLGALDDAETGQRGFLLTALEEYLEPFHSGAERVPKELAALQQAAGSDPELRARVEAIRLLTAKKFSEMDLTIRLFSRFGPEAALKEVKTGVGKQTMDQIRALCHQIESSEYARLNKNSNETARYGQEALLVTTIGSTALVVLLIVALILIRSANEQRDLNIGQLRDQAFMLDLANDTIFIRDSQDRIIYWNQGAQRLYGWSKEEALGQVTHSLFKTQFPQPLADIQAQLLAQDHWNGELRHTRRDDSLITVASTWTLQHDKSNHLASVLEINHDITARKEAERRLLERSIQLEAANKELEEFAYVASHDLKAPLRVIDNASKWLEEDLAGHLTDETREHLTLLRGRVKRMEKLLDDLLAYARIGRSTDSRYTEVISGDLLMDEVLMLLSAERFTLTVSPCFKSIQVCRMPLQQILMNLIGNAIKHHDKKEGRIDVTVEDCGGHYAFAVQDDGPGIAPCFHEQIFQMFQTLRPRDQVEGSGIGLALVRKHINVFGGSLELKSAEGEGSTFRFTWPKQQQLKKEAA
jgi:PAS domain S-box-containing protein